MLTQDLSDYLWGDRDTVFSR